MTKYISYHLFGDEWDEWYSTRKEADEAYKNSDAPNLRLYKTISTDDTTDAPEEIYLKGRGNYPW